MHFKKHLNKMKKPIHYFQKKLIKYQWNIHYIFHNLEYQNNLVKNIQNIKVIIYHKYLKLKQILQIYQYQNIIKIHILLIKFHIYLIKMKKLNINKD